MKTLSCSLALILAVTTTTAYAGLNDPVTVNPAHVNAAGKRPVLIYYANETTEADKFGRVIKWLRSIDEAKANEFAKRVDIDLREFRTAVDDEIAVLKKYATAPERENRPVVVAFTTRDAQKDEFAYFGGDDPQVRRVHFEVPDFQEDACESQLSEEQLDDLPTNIGRLYTADKDGLKYRTLQYDSVFARQQAGVSLADAVSQELLVKQDSQESPAAE